MTGFYHPIPEARHGGGGTWSRPALEAEASVQHMIHQGACGCLTLGGLEGDAAGSVAREFVEVEAEGAGLAGRE